MSARLRSLVAELEGEDAATVVIRRDGFVVRTLCSCGVVAGCEHVDAAARDLDAIARELAAPPPSVRAVAGSAPAPPTWEENIRAETMASVLRVLMQAMLRAAAGEVTAAVDEALRAASEALTDHPLPGAARVLSRVTACLGSRGTAAETALAIAALDEVVAAFAGHRGDEARAEVLGSGAELMRLDDVELVEVARARERGPVCWETRLLVDPRDGGLYREEGAAGAPTLSAGTTGRRVLASLASCKASRQPQRIALLQYSLEPAASEAWLRRAAEAASAELGMPETLRQAPLFAVAYPPVAWLAPAEIRVERGAPPRLVSRSGALVVLDVARDPGAWEALGELLEHGAEPRAVGGAWQVDVDGVRLQPWSILVEQRGRLELVNLAI